MRVVTYNIHSQRDDQGALAEVVRSLEPDVVVLQEAPRRWRWRTRCANLAHSFGLLVAVGGLPSLGNLILTNLRVRVTDSWCVRYPLTPGRHLRGAAFARCTVPGLDGSVLIVGTHLSTNDTERPAQAALLRPHLDADDDPVVLAADFNEPPDGPSWQLLGADLVDAGADSGPTFPARSPDRRIDTIFVDPRLKVARCEVVDSPPAVRASDHLPVVADLVIPSS